VSPIVIVLVVALIVSGIGLIAFIMLHSGKGTGVSDAIASSLYNNSTSTGLVEKNLDKITIIFAIVFLVALILLMIFYPKGSIG